MRSGKLAVAGAALYWEEHGDGPAIVLAHGVGGNHAIWFRQLGPLSRAHRVITFDHRGFGCSVDHDGRGRAAFAEDLHALLDHLRVERALLVGQSMGGGTCIDFACRWPERVAALAVADSLHAIAEPDDVAPLMDAARASTANLDQIDRVLGARARAEDATLGVLYAQINSFNVVDRHSLSGAFPRHAPEAIGGGRFPILFVAGVEDVLFPVEAIRRVQARVPGSFMVELIDAGHSAFLERATEFNDTLLTLAQMAGHAGRVAAHSNSAGYAAT
ncbi:alpha/beta hydrolase [Sphingomonas sp. AR_OL41]|uniref:alpha/beta fold hydrolase n=1 Tax=Sphingomonas sp. AR_OL41 TaxID=3042729 RepID=UPI0024807FC6|nr:alpha/beta hydrolase [Sphingomonas sp. AR_OL41]MDH7972092.1 alpha/beta hydrolase [Sphingomonas sp. AR_OL41]